MSGPGGELQCNWRFTIRFYVGALVVPGKPIAVDGSRLAHVPCTKIYVACLTHNE